MTDKELLELAAKAAGMTDAKYHDFAGMEIRYGFESAMWSDEEDSYWNPLVDDGDALRLAVKLNLQINPEIRTDHGPSATAYDGCKGIATVSHNAGPYAATRCAIVRAAAEIAKSMGHKA